jgi:hypothetical protein
VLVAPGILTGPPPEFFRHCKITGLSLPKPATKVIWLPTTSVQITGSVFVVRTGTAAKLAEPAKYNPTKTTNPTLTPGTKPRTHRFITFSSEV